jgi:hypothetical protein
MSHIGAGPSFLRYQIAAIGHYSAYLGTWEGGRLFADDA